MTRCNLLFAHNGGYRRWNLYDGTIDLCWIPGSLFVSSWLSRHGNSFCFAWWVSFFRDQGGIGLMRSFYSFSFSFKFLPSTYRKVLAFPFGPLVKTLLLVSLKCDLGNCLSEPQVSWLPLVWILWNRVVIPKHSITTWIVVNISRRMDVKPVFMLCCRPMNHLFFKCFFLNFRLKTCYSVRYLQFKTFIYFGIHRDHIVKVNICFLVLFVSVLLFSLRWFTAVSIEDAIFVVVVFLIPQNPTCFCNSV